MSLARTTPTLPVELLTQIIIEAGTNDRVDIPFLMRVSRLWHNTIINLPQLWSKVSLYLNSDVPSRRAAERTALRCIERSGSADLDITLHFSLHPMRCDCYQDYEHHICSLCKGRVDWQRTAILILAGPDRAYMPRWCRLKLRNNALPQYHQTLWFDRVLAPLIDDWPTPRLHTLSFKCWDDVLLSFCHTPLLKKVTLQQGPQLHIANWGGVKKLSIADEPPQGLVASGASTVMTHLILHIPIFCSQLTLPNVTDLEIRDSRRTDRYLELPTLPSVQSILISTPMDDLWPAIPLHQYPTTKRLSLRYADDGPPTPSFIDSLVGFIRSSCVTLEELDVDSLLLDSIVEVGSRYLPNLKRLFVMGKEMELWPANIADS
jgi:hypothetical protein